ncbi:MAG: lipoate--protein ligase [Deltaproteobacteria bacterium]|jgi:lipoate-protein ligase A|nr:lipoate--protein ligase [Deltaproteobacteria bacterium]
MKILHLTGVDPWTNLATEEYIFRHMGEEDCLLLWRNDKTIVVGLHQNALEEINTAFVEENGIKVVRRITGGGAVYHDMGNLNFSFITRAEDAARMTMERFTLPIARVLSSLGLQAEAGGRNDILAGGCKVSGNAQALFKKRFLHHGTLLFDADLSMLSKALLVKPEKFLSKSIKSVRARVANIKDMLPPGLNLDIHGLAERIALGLSQDGRAQELYLTDKDMAAIRSLRDDKYAAWEWNFGQSPPFNFKNMRKYPGGFLEVLLDVREGRLAGCRFFGDFMSLRPAEEAAERLLGLKYARSELEEALSPLPLEEYFGSVTRQELLDCIMGAEETNTAMI